MTTAWLISALLLLRFAVDIQNQGILAPPFWGLVVLTLTVMFINSVAKVTTQDARKVRDWPMRVMLLSSIPIGFVASSLDCTGLSLRGCSPFCTIIKLVWIPLIAVVCMGYYMTRNRLGPALLLLMSFVPLIPHCVCRNVANAWWIDHIGASPECYVWGFAVSTLALGALGAGKRYRVTLTVTSLIIIGSLGFFVGHHYLGFPW